MKHTKDLGEEVIRMGQHADQRFNRLEVGQARLAADIADVRADLTEVKATQSEHGFRLGRIEVIQAEMRADQQQIISVMNENFGKLFALLNAKAEPAE